MAQDKNRYRTWLLAGTVIALGALGIAGAVQAQGFLGGMRGHGFGGPMGGMMVERALGAVDATDAQRTQIEAIIEDAKADMSTLAAELDDTRAQFKTLITAPTIDRSAFEALRVATLERGDAASARALEALLDVAEVLTPEQRSQLAEHGPGFGPRFHRGVGPGRP